MSVPNVMSAVDQDKTNRYKTILTHAIVTLFCFSMTILFAMFDILWGSLVWFICFVISFNVCVNIFKEERSVSDVEARYYSPLRSG